MTYVLSNSIHDSVFGCFCVWTRGRGFHKTQVRHASLTRQRSSAFKAQHHHRHRSVSLFPSTNNLSISLYIHTSLSLSHALDLPPQGWIALIDLICVLSVSIQYCSRFLRTTLIKLLCLCLYLQPQKAFVVSLCD